MLRDTVVDSSHLAFSSCPTSLHPCSPIFLLETDLLHSWALCLPCAEQPAPQQPPESFHHRGPFIQAAHAFQARAGGPATAYLTEWSEEGKLFPLWLLSWSYGSLELPGAIASPSEGMSDWEDFRGHCLRLDSACIVLHTCFKQGAYLHGREVRTSPGSSSTRPSCDWRMLEMNVKAAFPLTG